MRSVILALLVLLAPLSHAQEWRTEPLSAIDQRYIEDARGRLDDIARRHLGRQFSGDQQFDLRLLQTMLDRQLVRRDQIDLLQAMGFVLGDLLKREENLNWVIYIDKRGRSRALEVPGKREFIFPVTMISRRVEAGIDVNVEEIYQRARGISRDIKGRTGFF